MGDPLSTAVSAAALLLRFVFLGGFYATKWILWLTWPIWAVVAGFGAVCGLNK